MTDIASALADTGRPPEPEPATALVEVKAPNAMVSAILPKSFEEVVRFADMMASSGMIPVGYRKDRPVGPNGAKLGNAEDQPGDPNKVAVAIFHGMEVGLKPMQALQSIGVINGVPALYGDGALAVVMSSGVVEDFSELPIIGSYTGAGENRGDPAVKIDNAVIGYTCTLKRRGLATPVVRTFTIEDAKKANLWGKAGPWTFYPQRMLQMRARAFTMRDSCADILKGLPIFEEARDIGPLTAVTPALPAPGSTGVRTAGTAAGKMDAFAAKPAPAPDVQDADFEPTGGDATAALPEMPKEVRGALDQGKSKPFMDWMYGEAKAMTEPAQRQRLADAHMEALLSLRGVSDRNAGALDNFAASIGVTMHKDGEVVGGPSN